jgi:hypothetical protein
VPVGEEAWGAQLARLATDSCVRTTHAYTDLQGASWH